MENLLEFKAFRDLKDLRDEEKFFSDQNYSLSYKERVKKYDMSIPRQTGILGKVGNFFGEVEDKFDEISQRYGSIMRSNRGSRAGNGGPNTGVEGFFRLFSVVPGVLKRVFGSTKYDTGNLGAEDKIDLDFMRHTNDVFAKEELPEIKSQKDLASNVIKTYTKAGVRPRQVPVLDEIMRNRMALYFSKHPYEVRVPANLSELELAAAI